MARLQGIKFRTKMSLGYISVLALMSIIAWVVYLNINALVEINRWVDHTYRVIRTVERCTRFLVDMETGVRGFLVAGKDEFLEPYQRGTGQFEREWTLGVELTRDNPSQTRRWKEVKQLKERWLSDVALPEIHMRKKVRKGDEALREFQELSTRHKGRGVFDELRALLTDLHARFTRGGSHEGADLAMLLTVDLLNQETGQRGFLLSGHEDALEPFHLGQDQLTEHFDALGKIDFTAYGIGPDTLARLETLVRRWHEKTATPEIQARRKMNRHPEKLADVTALLESGTGKALTDEIRKVMGEIIAEEEELLLLREKEAQTTAGRTVTVTIAGTLIAVFMGGFIGFLTVSTITRQLGGEPADIAALAKQVSGGDLSMALVSERKNTIGLYASLIRMVENLNRVVGQADAISRGDYAEKIEPRSERDDLGHALVRMTDELRRVSARNELESRQKTGHNDLNDQLRGEQDSAALANAVITCLAEFFGAQVGAFYLASEEGLLALSASYAYRKRKNLSSHFAVGEGLVGQAARERKPILVTEVPEDYIRITSGLGSAAPASILVYPLQLMGDLKGVIELGSVRVFSDHDFDFLELVGESIAIALASADSRQRMKALLDRTQQQAEDLKVQQEELREANETLEIQKRSLLESETRLQAQQEELRQTNEELEEQAQLLEEQKNATQDRNMELARTRQLIEKKAQDLEQTSKYKSEFLANMSHELRTPLNSILLLSRLLADNSGANLTPKQQEYSQTIHMSGTELLELINEILDLSKIESGKMEIHVERLALSELLHRMERAFKPQAKEKNIALTIKRDGKLPEHIRTDRQRLDQIIKNLISNALKFTQRGSITLSVFRPPKETDLSGYGLDAASAIAFSVADTGEGIPEEKQKLVFEAFQQADGTTSRKFGGSGLGLSIARELAKLLGGTIHLASQPGEGCTFTVYLPESVERKSQAGVGGAPAPAIPHKLDRDAVAAENPEASSPGAPLAEAAVVPDDRHKLRPEDKSILIIEDDPNFAGTLADLSRERGYKVMVAGDGETGLHYADFYKPNAIILDVGLPGMDGWSVMARLKEHADTRHIPVHFISAQDKEMEALKMGAVGFITKPVSLSLLDTAFQKIERLIEGNIRELLVVEDDHVQRTAMVALIGNGDVHTTEAATAEEAFRLLATRTFDCMILDLGLPDMAGMEFLTKMKEDTSITEIPIIIYTGKELTSEEEAIIGEYAEKIIIKDARSAEKLIDETTLFLHRVEANLPAEKRRMIRKVHDRESVFEKKKILVVDDDMRNVFAVTNVLEEKGLKVLAAKDGAGGLECLRKNPDVNLVLMDIMMPEMDGYDAIRSIRLDDRFRKLPIIALTAKAMKGDRRKCIAAGASDYLSKPVNTDKLLSMMRVWLY